MPRRSLIRCPAIRDLAAQVRFASRSALLRQVERAEALAAELEAGRDYPDDWLVFRITGFAPKNIEPALRRGAELLADLSALVEHLCDRAKATTDDMPAGSIGINDLCERWGITRKTIERLRRTGLIARRIRQPADPRRVQLCFSPGIVQLFEARNPRLASPPERAERIGPEERARAVAWATRLHARTGCSLHTAAQRLAQRTGRSTASMRRVLSAVEAGAPVFTVKGGLTPRMRAVSWRAFRWAIAPRRIGERLGVTGATAKRGAWLHRLALLRAVCRAIPAEPPLPDGADPEMYLDEPSVTGGLGAPLDLSPGAIVARADEPSPGPRREHELACACRALHLRAVATVRDISTTSPRGSDMDRAETDLRWAALLERELLRLALPVVARNVLEHAGADAGEAVRARLICAGVQAAVDALARFDPFEGGRLAGAITLPVSRAVAAAARAQTPAHLSTPPPAIELRNPRNPWWLWPPPALVRGLDRLADADLATAFRLIWGDAGGRPLNGSEIYRRFKFDPSELSVGYRRALKLGNVVPLGKKKRRSK